MEDLYGTRMVLIDNLDKYSILVKGEDLIERIRKEGFPVYSYSDLQVLEYSDIDIKCSVEVIEIDKGDTVKVNVAFQCDDNDFYLNKDNYALAYHIYGTDRNCLLWDGRRTPFSNVYNGMVVTLEINDPIFSRRGEYILQIDLVEEGVTWLSDKGLDTPEIKIIVR